MLERGVEKGTKIGLRDMNEGQKQRLTCVEICAGAGGQALGLEQAGFEHIALIEIEPQYCQILKENRPEWNVICADAGSITGTDFGQVDLFAGGVPCPPFSKAGKQLGEEDERDLFPVALRLIEEIEPRAVLLENVRGFLDSVFDEYRQRILDQLDELGYDTYIKLVKASDHGVPQLRPRTVIVGIAKTEGAQFAFPESNEGEAPTVGDALFDLMAENGWEGAEEWKRNADRIAPTLVGGSKKHGGPDLGPTRAKKAWAALGVNGKSIADAAPEKGYQDMPRLTPRMMARLQGFPDEWSFTTRKTTTCRMIGNAFPPPVAKAVGTKIKECIAHG